MYYILKSQENKSTLNLSEIHSLCKCILQVERVKMGSLPLKWDGNSESERLRLTVNAAWLTQFNILARTF